MIRFLLAINPGNRDFNISFLGKNRIYCHFCFDNFLQGGKRKDMSSQKQSKKQKTDQLSLKKQKLSSAASSPASKSSAAKSKAKPKKASSKKDKTIKKDTPNDKIQSNEINTSKVNTSKVNAPEVKPSKEKASEAKPHEATPDAPKKDEDPKPKKESSAKSNAVDQKPKHKWKKPLAIVVIIAALCGAGCAAKYKYDEETNILSLKVDKKMPIQLEEKTANKFKAKDIVRKCTGDLKISGKLSSQKYKKQPITFTYTKGWSTKKETVNIFVIKANTEPKIVLKNSLINVQKDDKDFKPSNVIKSITDCNGHTIPLKSHTKIYKKDLKKKKNIAYFVGDPIDVSKTGVYTVKLKVFDDQGVRSEATFVVNVTNNKKESDKKIEEIKNNIFESGTSGSQSGNVEIREEVVESGNDYRPSSSTPGVSRGTSTGRNQGSSFVIRDDTDKSDHSSGNTSSPANDPTPTPTPEAPATPAVDNSTVFSDYRAALNKAREIGSHVETTQDSKGNTIYVIVN